jgi:hypothetical protein
VKAFVHTPTGDYEVEANYLRPDVKGDIVTLWGSDGGDGSNGRPLATIKLSPQSFILYGDEHPKEREGVSFGIA